MTTSTLKLAKATRRFGLAAIAALMLLTPVAQANHLVLYYTRDTDGEPLEPGIGRVREDDGQVSRQPGGELDAIANKVLLNTSDELGAGDLMLDAHWYTMFQTSSDVNYHVSPFVDDQYRMFGIGGFIGWYGWWNDLDNDSRINDFHDDHGSKCPVTFQDCGPHDEFTWRGAGNGHSMSMVLYMLPGTTGQNSQDQDADRLADTSAAPTRQFSAWQNGSIVTPDDTFDDRTERSEEQQMWVAGIGWGWTWTDESLLMTTQTIVAANAKRVSGKVGYDLKDPAASIDVDTYPALNADAENLWTSNARSVRAQYMAVRALPQNIGPMVNGFVAQVTGAVANAGQTVNDATRPVGNITSELNEGIARNQTNVNRQLAPPFLKEPNDAKDAFVGAAFDGTPDVRGFGNDYSSSAGAHHLFLDITTRALVPAGANLVIGPLNTAVGVYGLTVAHGYEPLPCNACGESQRQIAPGFLNVVGNVGLWKDKNGDKWVGRVCDPAKADQWDATVGECSNENLNGGSQSWGNTGVTGEVIAVCGQTTANGGGAAGRVDGVKIRPAPGYTWEDAAHGNDAVVKVRWYDRPSYNVWNTDEMQRPTGTEEVQFELDGCTGEAVGFRTLDALLIPGGSLEIAIEVELTVTMKSAYTDATGITVPIESATDFDLYLASM